MLRVTTRMGAPQIKLEDSSMDPRLANALLFRVCARIEELSMGERWIVQPYLNANLVEIELASDKAIEAGRAVHVLHQVAAELGK